MELTLFHLVGIFIGGLFFSALFSMIEAAVISQDRHRLNSLSDSGDKAAKIVTEMMGKIDMLLAGILLFNNIANVLCATAAAMITGRLYSGSEAAAFIVSLGVAFVILVLSEITPKIIAVNNATKIALIFARPLKILLFLFYPVIVVANFIANQIIRCVGIENNNGLNTVMNRKELRSAVKKSDRNAIQSKDSITHKHYHMVEQMLLLADKKIEKIMTPRNKIVGINVQNHEKIISIILKTDHSKLPIYDGTIDNCIGFVNTLKLLKVARKGNITKKDLLNASTPPIFVPASNNALQQMDNMRKQGSKIVLVVNGAGLVTGTLTFSNFSEAIIGNQGATKNVKYTGDGGIIVGGDFPLREIGLHSHLIVPETPANNINGLITETLGGTMPKEKICIIAGDLKIEILDIDKTAIRKVIIHHAISA